MEVETLDDLKARNAKESEEAAKLAEETAKAKSDEQDALIEEELKKHDESDGSKADEDSEPAEDWLKADEAGDEKNDGKSIPLAAHIEIRTNLKAKVKEKDGELERLKQELEDIKKSVQKPAPVVESDVLEVPDPMDFNTTADYKKALDKYITSKTAEQLSLVNQTSSAKQRQEEQAKKQAEAVDSHYKRAAELVSANSISPDVYRDADLKVRQAIESVFPGGGDLITESLIESLGEGSEKVFFYLGRNESARSTLIAKLMTDKTGLQASMYLGRLQAEKSGQSATNTGSKAPAPAARVKGGSKSVVSAVELKRKYDAAHKRGDFAEALEAKYAAKEAGLNVKSW